MNKAVLWGVIGVVVVGGLVLMMQNPGTSDTAPLAGDSADIAASGAGSEMSMKQLLAGTASQKCTFSHDASGAASEGTVYVAGGKMRQDAKSTMNGVAIESHLLITGGEAHVWTSAMPKQGFKFDASITDSSAASGAASANSQVNLDQKFAFDCEPWSADQSVFALPAGVTFSDFSTMLKAGVKVGN